MANKISTAYCFLKYVVRAKKWYFSNRIYPPLLIDGIKNIQLGRNVYIHDNAFLLIRPLTGEDKCEFIMGDNSHLNFGAHVVATKSVKIGNNCSCSPYVYIADNSHGYEDIEVAPKFQKIRQLREVEIGDDTWLGRNVCVIGCKIGKHCVIGANCVVNRDVPDYCVVAGSPARIVRRYDVNSKKWKKTDEKGNFID